MKLRENIIEQIEQSLVWEKLSIPHLCYIMQSIRILIEIDDCKSKYPITTLYCNWLLHKELDRTNLPSTIIQNIANSFQNFNSKNELIKKINEAISLKKLIVEIKEILWGNINNKVIVSKIDFDEYWIRYIQLILSQILFRPIKLKQDKNEIPVNDFDLSIYGLQIIPLKDSYNIELLSKKLELEKKQLIIDIVLFRN